MWTMVGGWTLLILEVTGQRWRSWRASSTNVWCAGMLRFALLYLNYAISPRIMEIFWIYINFHDILKQTFLSKNIMKVDILLFLFTSVHRKNCRCNFIQWINILFFFLFSMYLINWVKKEEIWLVPMTKAPTPTEKSKKQCENTITPPKTSITQRMWTDWGRSVGVTIATQLVWLNRFTGFQPSH